MRAHGLHAMTVRAYQWDPVSRSVDAVRAMGDPDAAHSPAAHQAISDELVRLALGGRGPARPELTLPVQRPEADDMRLPGESFCADCPDREACATGWPCRKVRKADALVNACRV